MKSIVALCILFSLSVVARAEDPASAFQGFCEEWMEKLHERQVRNLSHIKWEPAADGVHGDYVTYSDEHTCITKNGTASVPVGKIIYREVRYEKIGTTVQEAEKNTPRALETTEVTEIFRYNNGKWIY